MTIALAEQHELSQQVRQLARELEEKNLELRRHLAERERMQAILLSTLQSLTDGVMAVGRDDIVIAANPAACRLLHVPLDRLAGRPLGGVLAEVPQSDELLLTLHGAGGGQSSIEWQKTGEGIETRQIEVTAVRALPPYDRSLAGIVLLHEVTELRRLEAQAQLRSRLTGMGEIAINLAHEIRNPLGSMELFSTTLEHELADSPEQAQLAAHITRGIRAIEHLVANTLQFARPRRLSLQRVALKPLLCETLAFLAHPIQQHGIEAIFDHDLAPDAVIDGDPEQLRQVFLNLCLNGIQAMECGGRLTIDLAAEPEAWRVNITDEGVGIPPELLGRVFDPFFTTREKGSGLGLAIVHRILAEHGAQLDMESRVAVGTRVIVRFPATHHPTGTNR